jgi:hypothetical protein
MVLKKTPVSTHLPIIYPRISATTNPTHYDSSIST